MTKIETELQGQLVAMQERSEDYRQALRQIEQWTEAYPEDIFPEPDWPKVKALLAAGGIALDAVSGSNMRHALEGVKKIAKRALE